MLTTEPYQEAQSLMKTTYERGVERGIFQGEQRSALRQLEAKFGPLPAAVKQRVEALPPDDLARLQLALLQAQSLQELGLAD